MREGEAAKATEIAQPLKNKESLQTLITVIINRKKRTHLINKSEFFNSAKIIVINLREIIDLKQHFKDHTPQANSIDQSQQPFTTMAL